MMTVTAAAAAPIALRLELSPNNNVGVEYLYDDGTVETEWVGAIDDPSTADRVPADLFDRIDELWIDHDDAVAFGVACEREARDTYTATRGRP